MDNSKRPKTFRFIGIDFGLARIGMSVSDELGIIAMPLSTVKTESKSESTADKVLAEMEKFMKLNNYEVKTIVIGLPLLMSGKSGLLADEVQHFIKLLQERTSIPIFTWDERLTSVQAEKSLREGSLSRKKRSKVVDQVSAVIILQNFLDHKNIQNLDKDHPFIL